MAGDVKAGEESSASATIPQITTNGAASNDSAPKDRQQQVDADTDDADGYSTTGWTSSEDDDDDDDEVAADDNDDDPEAESKRAAERMRVLQAAGILVVDDKPQDEPSRDTSADAATSAPRPEDALLLRRRTTRKKPKPERPQRKGEGQGKDELRVKDKARRPKPDRPQRRPPPPPKEKQPEEAMEDAYDRYVKLSRQVEMTHGAAAPAPSQVPEEPSQESAEPPERLNQQSPPQSQQQSFGTSVVSAGTGFLSSIRNRIGAGASAAPSERKATPTISGPLAVGSPMPSNASFDEKNSSMSADSTMTSQNATWTSLMGADSIKDMPDIERKRQEAIFELIATETTHVRDLQIIVEEFFNTIQPMLSAKAATVIFANVEEILLAAVSLLSDMEERQRSERLFISRIGDILDSHMTGMSVYIPYCVNQGTAAQILSAERNRNPQLQVQLTKLRNESPAARGLDLSHFLLTPMQRLTRYPLLIQQIIKYTSDTHDQDELASLQAAALKAQQFLDRTNESIRQRQSEERLAALSDRINNLAGETQIRLDLTHPTRFMGPRRILVDEVVTKHKSGRKITVILCNDILLLMTGGPDADERLYRMPMPLEELVVRDVGSSLKGRDDAALQLVHQGRERTSLRCHSARACHTLMHSIESARGDCLATANKHAGGGGSYKRRERVASQQ